MRIKYVIINITLLFFFAGFSLKAQEYVITRLGAVPDGVTLNTKAIQNVIDQVSKNNGGRIVFPAGVFLIGSIELKDGVELFLEKGTVLKGSTNPLDYYKLDCADKPATNRKTKIIVNFLIVFSI
jgi:polygalacturonase